MLRSPAFASAGRIGAAIEIIPKIGTQTNLLAVIRHAEEISLIVAAAMTDQGAATTEIARSIEQVAPVPEISIVVCVV